MLPANYSVYISGKASFVPYLLPEKAIALPVSRVLQLLRSRYGVVVDLALSEACCDPQKPAVLLPAEIQSPVGSQLDGNWIKTAKMVGVNLRTVEGFWGLAAYSLTLPAAHNSIHLLPVCEPGVAGSLYGMVSWNINTEFYSPSLAAVCPWLDTPAKQLKAVINLLHMQGRTVGMDVIPHTDRFSEMVLANPGYFEWLERKDMTIVDHHSGLYRQVENEVYRFLYECGPAVAGEKMPGSQAAFFSDRYGEEARLLKLFGEPADFPRRLARRKQLIRRLYDRGYETVPATMAPPFRGIEVDPAPEAVVVDMDGLVWRDYRISKPESMSRVFNPLTRYKLYESKNSNRDWELDFDKPRPKVWQYVCEQYARQQRNFGFDFMRGDMSHVQMNPVGVPGEPGPYYDLLGAVKTHIQQEVPGFAYFAESFLAPPNVMGYGDEVDHLEASRAEVTLGDLQSAPVGSPDFLQRLDQYVHIKNTHSCTPCQTVMTADKDDPRFDSFYLAGNELRLLFSFFLTDMPAYMGLGFEIRDRHERPAANEHYSKLYVFHEDRGPKATRGPYLWGQNRKLYTNITRLRLYIESIWERIDGKPTCWLIAPDGSGESKLVAWTQADRPEYVLVGNTDLQADSGPFEMPFEQPDEMLSLDFSTMEEIPQVDRILRRNGNYIHLAGLGPGEGRVYRISNKEAEHA